MAAPMSVTTKIPSSSGTKQARVLFPSRPEIEDRSRREEDGHQQHIFQAGGDKHEDRVDNRDPSKIWSRPRSFWRRLIAGSAARKQNAIGGDEQIGHQRHHAAHVEHEVEGVARPVGRDDEQRDDDVRDPKRIRGDFVAVLRSEQPRHVLRLAGGEGHFGGRSGSRREMRQAPRPARRWRSAPLPSARRRVRAPPRARDLRRQRSRRAAPSRMGRSVIAIIRPVTATKPRMVAAPTSERFCA